MLKNTKQWKIMRLENRECLKQNGGELLFTHFTSLPRAVDIVSNHHLHLSVVSSIVHIHSVRKICLYKAKDGGTVKQKTGQECVWEKAIKRLIYLTYLKLIFLYFLALGVSNENNLKMIEDHSIHLPHASAPHTLRVIGVSCLQ